MYKFEKKYVLRVSDFDCYDRLRPSAILDFFQDVAGQNADEMGIGYRELIKKDVIWVLLRNRFDVIKSPVPYSSVIVKTYPHKPGRGDFDRDYYIESPTGETYIKGSSKWCLINFKTRKILFGDEGKCDGDEYTETCVYPEGVKKIKNFSEEGFEKFSGRTEFSDLDHNGHVNNVKYLDYVFNAVKPGKSEEVTSLEIDYVHEMQANSAYDIFYKKIDGAYYIKCISGGSEIFRAIMGVK